MKRILTSTLGLLALCTAAFAQINVTPQVGVTSGYVAKATYSAVFIGLVPAASTTDLVCIAGSATKTIRLQNFTISGSGTAISIPITLLRRAAANTGGTAAGTTANPANTISKRDTGQATASATLIAYTANPTIPDSAPTYIDSQQLGVVATTVGVINSPNVFDFGGDDPSLLQPPTLRGAAQQICLNLNATSATALLTGSLTWTEE